MIVLVQPVIVSPASAALSWTLQSFLEKISHRHQLQLRCGLNKRGVEIRAPPLFFKYYLMSFLLKRPQPAGQNAPHFGMQLIFLIMNLSSIVACDLKGLFPPKLFSDSMFVQLVESLIEPS